MNILRVVADEAMPNAEELEAEGAELIAKARQKYQDAALARMHAAIQRPTVKEAT